MRQYACFVPATDDEIYAAIEKYGFGVLHAYRVGLPILRPPTVSEATAAQPPLPEHEPRRAA